MLPCSFLGRKGLLGQAPYIRNWLTLAGRISNITISFCYSLLGRPHLWRMQLCVVTPPDQQTAKLADDQFIKRVLGLDSCENCHV